MAGRSAVSVKRNIVANYAGSAWGALMGIAFLPLYISYLGMEAYGLIAVFATLQAWLSLIDTGLAPTLNREMARFRGGEHTARSIRDLLRSLEYIYLALGLLATLGVTLAAPWLATVWLKARELPVDVMAQALALMGLLIGLRWSAGLYRSAIAGLQEQVWLNISVIVFATLRGVGVVAILAWISPTIQAFFIYQALIGGLEAVALAVMAYWFLPPSGARARFSREALQRIWKFAGGMMMITFLAVLLTQVDKLLLSGLVPLEQFGHYALASVVAGALYLLAGPISVAMGPRFAELVARGDDAGLREAYHTAAQLVTVAVAPTAMLIIFFAEPLLLLWTGDAEIARQVAPLARILVLGTLLNTLVQIPYALTLAYGWTRIGIIINGVAVAVLIPSIFLTVPAFGAVGAATLWLVLNIAYVSLAVPIILSILLRGSIRRWVTQDIFLPLAPAFATVTVASLIPISANPLGFRGFIVLVLIVGLSQIMAIAAAPKSRVFLNALMKRQALHVPDS